MNELNNLLSKALPVGLQFKLSQYLTKLKFLSAKHSSIEATLEKRSIYHWLLILVAGAFMGIKVGVPIIYEGSYIDEYNHILSGVEFFKSGHFAEVYKGAYYTRGSSVSILTGFFLQLLGKTIFVAKMVPVLISIACFCIFYKLCNYILGDKRFTLISLLIYTSVPWFIFNHFYIRMYVMYEFLLLLLTFLFIKAIANTNNIQKFLGYFFTSILISFLLYLFEDGNGRYIILLYSFLFTIYLGIFEIPIALQFKYKARHLFKLLPLTILGIALLLNNELFSIFEYFTTGTLQFSSGENHKYHDLFFKKNLLFTIFFLSSIFLVPLKNTRKIVKLVIGASLLLFLVHYTSSTSFQITRGIIYFLPLFFLVAVKSYLDFTKLINSRIISSLILLGFAYHVYSNYPNDFLSKGPYIPTEVNYREYAKGAEITDEYAVSSKDVVITNFPHIYKFYSHKYDYYKQNDENVYLLRDNASSFYDARLKYQNQKGHTVYTISGDPIITDLKELKSIMDLQPQKIVVSLDKVFYSYWSKDTTRQFIQHHCQKEFENDQFLIYSREDL